MRGNLWHIALSLLHPPLSLSLSLSEFIYAFIIGEIFFLVFHGISQRLYK